MSIYRRHNLKAFTLIELLIVIVIIGLLSTVATTSYLSAQRRARDDSRKAQIYNISTALETYYNAKQSFPGFFDKKEQNPNAILSQAANNPLEGCVQYDIPRDNYYYYYYPTGTTSTNSNQSLKQNCSQRPNNSVSGFPYDATSYRPAGSWIPGLSPYLNPMPIEINYLDSNNTGVGAYDPNKDMLTADGNNARTIVYRKLNRGYMVYTRLENVSEGVVGGSTTLTDSPNLNSGSIPITGKNVFLVRK